MTEPIEDRSMVLWAPAGRDLVTRDMALARANMIFKDVYREEDFEDSLLCTFRKRDYSKAVNNLVDGKIVIEIMKDNCRIVKLTQKMDFAVP